MGKIKMMVENDVTFSEGCDEYILDCKARNLRGGTLVVSRIFRKKVCSLWYE